MALTPKRLFLYLCISISLLRPYTLFSRSPLVNKTLLEYIVERLCVFIWSRRDLAFNVLIAKTGHELILQCPVQVFTKFAGDCSMFQTIAEIDEALRRFPDTVSEGGGCCCCGSLYLSYSIL